MRVGFLLPSRLERPTGIVTYARRLATTMREVDDRVEVVLLDRSKGERPDWLSDFEVVQTPGGLSLWRALPDIAEANKLDIVHGSGNISPFLTGNRPFKQVATIHDLGPLVFPQSRPMRERFTHTLALRRLRRSADAVICISQATATDVARHLKIDERRIAVTRLATNWPTKSGANGSPTERTPYFLAVGDVAVHKNLVRVIRALDRVRTRHPSISLVMIGADKFGSGEIRKAAEPVAAHVEFAGYVSDDERDDLYAGARALIFPSLYEGFGMPILEAMARGVPVITSNRSAMVEVAGDAALLVDPLTVQDIADAMERILTEPTLAEDLRTAGYRRAHEFRWEDTARQTIQVYDDVLAQKPVGRGEDRTSPRLGRRVA